MIAKVDTGKKMGEGSAAILIFEQKHPARLRSTSSSSRLQSTMRSIVVAGVERDETHFRLARSTAVNSEQPPDRHDVRWSFSGGAGVRPSGGDSHSMRLFGSGSVSSQLFYIRCSYFGVVVSTESTIRI